MKLTAIPAIAPVVALAACLPVLHAANAQSVDGWVSEGCYTDHEGLRTLLGPSSTITSMTIESCIEFCGDQDGLYVYAGVEDGQQCWCGNGIENLGEPAASSNCDMACTGDSSEICGGDYYMNIYWSRIPPPPPPVTVYQVGYWVSLGCYSDSPDARTLTTGSDLEPDTITVQSCTSYCYDNGYNYAGVEYSQQCFCGSAIENGGVPINLSNCDMLCAGNSSEFCGGDDTLDVSAALRRHVQTALMLPPALRLQLMGSLFVPRQIV
ncbi:hypothetical protein IEO21_02145 [Rhodonia placenta]|uniref:WSC domain-containing protein n=1 Tax=Rhodonia placenta TaxID=104341 RepID=A0A8H7U4T0_9APHY|nr:hypothetical protein IEO21_02145 [Postia placenta]